MKKIINLFLFTALCFASALSYAQEDRKKRELVLGACSAFSELAENTMELRQYGLPLREAMEMVKEGVTADFERSLIVDAYEYPLVPKQIVKRIVTEFANEQYLKCMKEISK